MTNDQPPAEQGRAVLEWWFARRQLRGAQPGQWLSLIAWIGVCSIAIGVAVLMVVLSVMNGFEQELKDRLLAMTWQSTLSVTDDNPHDVREWLSTIQADPQVQSVAPYVEAKALAVRGAAVSAVWVQGVDLGQPSERAKLQAHLSQGQLASMTGRRFEVLLGEQLAKQLQVKVGETLLVAVPQGSVTPVGLLPRVRQFTVAGLVHSGLYELDQHLLVIQLNDAMRLFQLSQPTGLSIEWQSPWDARARVHALAVSLGGGFFVSDWSRSHENIFRSIETTKGILRVLLTLVLAVAAFNMVAMLMMMVREKHREVAILRTLGWAPWSVARVFVWQGLVMASLGTLVGLGLGLVIAHHLTAVVHGIEQHFHLLLVDPRVYSIDELPVVVTVRDTVWIVVSALVLGLSATLLPALSAARLKPAESLRHD